MPHKLLLADDSVTIQRVIELTFADEDIQVTVVGDGRHAIEQVKSNRPDIVLADIGMPERDGYEVAAFIKGDPQLAHIPVILLTGAFEPLDENRARSVGCDGVLVKPFEPQMVINRVRELLSGKRAVATVPAAPAAAAARPTAGMPSGTPKQTAAVPDIPDFEEVLAPPPGASRKDAGGEALEDYFDRLDAAFANIGSPLDAARPATPPEDLSGGIRELEPPPPARASLTEDPIHAWDPDLAGDFGPARQPDLANAFAALLAAEEGHMPDLSAAAFAAPLPESAIDDIVERVIARMSDDAVRRTVVDTAERLVREEIDRIKRHAQPNGATGPHNGR